MKSPKFVYHPSLQSASLKYVLGYVLYHIKAVFINYVYLINCHFKVKCVSLDNVVNRKISSATNAS